MSINRPIKKLIALVLAAGVVALAVQIAAAPVAAGDSGHSARVAHNHGNANGIPPILPRESASHLRAVTRRGRRWSSFPIRRRVLTTAMRT